MVIRYRVRPIVGKSLETRYLPPLRGREIARFEDSNQCRSPAVESLPLLANAPIASTKFCMQCELHQWRFLVTTQASYFSNAKHTILSPFGGENSVFGGKY